MVRQFTRYDAANVFHQVENGALEKIELAAMLPLGQGEVWPGSLKGTLCGDAFESVFSHQPEYETLMVFNLLAPDTALIDQFRRAIAQARESSNIYSRPGKIDGKVLKKWHENRLLACLEILVWAQLSKVRVTNDLLCDWVFRDFDVAKGEDSVRKYARKNALKLISESNIEALMQCKSGRF